MPLSSESEDEACKREHDVDGDDEDDDDDDDDDDVDDDDDDENDDHKVRSTPTRLKRVLPVTSITHRPHFDLIALPSHLVQSTFEEAFSVVISSA